MKPSFKYINSQLLYNSETGLFFWKVSRKKRILNKPIGCCRPDGYIEIGLDWRKFLAHRLAWLLIKKEWPKGKLDHINRNPSDNRMLNLREATNSENSWNTKINKKNTSGVKGVTFSKHAKKWHAKIMRKGKLISLGYFSNLGDAKNIREGAEKKFYGKFSSINLIK